MTKQEMAKQDYLAGMKYKDIAAKYNIEVPKVFEIRNTILSKFKDILVNQYQIKSYDDVME